MDDDKIFEGRRVLACKFGGPDFFWNTLALKSSLLVREPPVVSHLMFNRFRTKKKEKSSVHFMIGPGK